LAAGAAGLVVGAGLAGLAGFGAAERAAAHVFTTTNQTQVDRFISLLQVRGAAQARAIHYNVAGAGLFPPFLAGAAR